MPFRILASCAVLSFLALYHVVNTSNNVHVGGRKGMCFSLSRLDGSLSYFGPWQGPPISVDTDLFKSYRRMSFLLVLHLLFLQTVSYRCPRRFIEACNTCRRHPRTVRPFPVRNSFHCILRQSLILLKERCSRVSRMTTRRTRFFTWAISSLKVLSMVHWMFCPSCRRTGSKVYEATKTRKS